MNDQKWIADAMDKPFVEQFSKPCPWCGAEMIISDKTEARRRQKDILDIHGKCIVCKKQIHSSTVGNAETAISDFNKRYAKHKQTAMLKLGEYNMTQDNLWNYIGKANAICITTNGFTKRSGEAVMGRGCAAQALKRYPGLDKKLGDMIKEHGNRTMRLTRERGTSVVAFPVKPIYRSVSTKEELESKCVEHMIEHLSKDLGTKNRVFIPGWATKAEVGIIANSANQLVQMADKFDWKHIVLPLPGCGCGELTFDKDVKPILDEVLDQRFTLVTYPK